MQKNETAIVTIEDIGVNGEGIGRVDGYTLFIKDAVIGDVAEVKVTKAKKNYGYARLMRVITPSKDRVEPVCPHARRCGGCQIQEMSYERQLAFKQAKVKGNLERIGGFSPEVTEKTMDPIVGMDEPFYYRNKAQFPFGTDKAGNPVTGFYAGRTHDIIENVRVQKKMYIGEQTAEEIKKQIATAIPGDNVETISISGRDVETGLPHAIEINSNEVESYIHQSLREIVHATKTILEVTPPELASDIVQHGLVLTGGGALLKNLDQLMRDELKIPVYVAENALSCVVDGCQIMLENL